MSVDAVGSLQKTFFCKFVALESMSFFLLPPLCSSPTGWSDEEEEC